MTPGKSVKVTLNANLFCMLVKLMQAGAKSYDQLTVDTGLHSRTVRRWVAEMRRHELVHIGGWLVRGSGATPLWAWGGVDDMPRPKKTKHQIKRQQIAHYHAHVKPKRQAQAKLAPHATP